jgi:hypothetical protein
VNELSCNEMYLNILLLRHFKFAKGPIRDVQVENDRGQTPDEEKLMGCAPYLQVFKSGKLIHTSAATLYVQQSEEELPFVQVMDGTVPFNIGEIIQGDILIRCRHLTFNKKRISMFRAAFHTGYVPPNVLRLTKSQLDGACNDDRYPDNFFLDLIFEKIDDETIAKHLMEHGQEVDDPDNEQQDKKGRGGAIVKASKFDSMLEGDSRFWDIINQKKQEHMKQSSNDPLRGPTVGRRRGEGAKSSKDDVKMRQSAPPKARTHMETFSIGNELDFLPNEEEAKPQRDSLMDALNALDEDEAANHELQSEEIVFGNHSASGSQTPVFVMMDDGSTAALEAKAGHESAGQSKPKSASAEPEDAPTYKEADAAPQDNVVDDMDTLLATADEDFGDLDFDGLDGDDDDLEDLESMLKT